MKSSRLAAAIALAIGAAACRDQASAPVAPADGTRTISAQMSATGAENAAPEALVHAVIHQTVEGAAAARATRHGGGGSVNLYYHGGIGSVGVETAPKIYLVVWGSQWNNNDPSGEVAILENFYSGVGGSAWLASVTQYCEGIASGSSACSGSFAETQAAAYAGVFVDNASAAPSKPTQSQIAAEAVRAAQFFGNTTAASNSTVQYVVATSTGHNSSGFKTQYCAYHSSTSSIYGNVAYTNLPYITDAGTSCGANFLNLGASAGITIVSGHEAAESITDQFPNGGWLDSSGAENADKCAWTSGTGNTTLSTGVYPVQPLWSNKAASGAGACAMSYP